ncbi:hypothetical protein AMJ51_01345 [Microgenomates bacterium DG_75]|nr:MAG: hypothetical protein AMJ51_01345 [Microgenomates bacterium DG_75]
MRLVKTVALVGQPNSGKSCLINHLTSTHALVSNYPGTTVEVTRGDFTWQRRKIEVIDTPGTYTLHSDTLEQRLTQKILLEEKIDVIVNLVDATNLARHLYFTLLKIDFSKLAKILGIPVIPISALTGEGLDQLKKAIFEKASKGIPMCFTEPVEKIVGALKKEIEGGLGEKTLSHPPRALSIHLLEKDIGDEEVFKIYPKLESLVENFRKKIGTVEETVCETCPAKPLCQPKDLKYFLLLTCRQRYERAFQIAHQVKKETHRQRKNWLERLEELIDNPWLSLPLLFFLAAATFKLIVWITNGLSTLLSFLLTPLLAYLTNFLENLFPKSTLGHVFALAAPEGILVPLTIVLPAMLSVYLLLAFLEDSGFLARFAVVLNRFFGFLGLGGQAGIPLLLSFGCRVPGVLATRILPDKRERLLTSTLLSITVPCAATLGIITGVVVKFGASILTLISVLIFSFILLGFFLNQFLPGKKEPLSLEVPPLRFPYLKNLIFKTWFRMRSFFTRVLPLLVILSVGIRILLELQIFVWLEQTSFLTMKIFGISGEVMAGVLVTVIQRYLAPLVLLNLPLTSREATIASAMILVSFPCLPNLAVLWKEFGLKEAVKIFLLAAMTFVLIGLILNFLLP